MVLFSAIGTTTQWTYMELVNVLQSYSESAKHEINMTFEVKQDNSQTIIVCYSIENLQAMQQHQQR